ncbi:hypothetical protein MCW82_07065 [Azospirillum doebereinerae]|uniref:hypothetical protein n=1 Tax=Azospirillum doebereinerae TaxID=92933 RepID=UPI001EE50225|nr:hypothetical protein [Azospirillum doebereinerae]MCG5239527.1 hypothetical protein [Azospirillum doebereinerae]
MSHIVAKTFSTAHRRFAEGDKVRASDITGPVPFARWVELGHLVPPKPSDRKAAKPAPPPAN